MQVGDEHFARIVVHWLVLEHRVIYAWKLEDIQAARLFCMCTCIARKARQSAARAPGDPRRDRASADRKTAVPNRFNEERDAFVAIAAMRVTSMREKALRPCSVALARAFRTVGGYCAFRALRRDRARSVREQQPDEGLEREQVIGVASNSAALRRPSRLTCVRRATLRSRSPRTLRVRGPTRRLEAPTRCRRASSTRATLRRQARDALAHERPPSERCRDRREHRVRTRMTRDTRKPTNERQNSRRARRDREHRFGHRVALVSECCAIRYR